MSLLNVGVCVAATLAAGAAFCATGAGACRQATAAASQISAPTLFLRIDIKADYQILEAGLGRGISLQHLRIVPWDDVVHGVRQLPMVV